jgi:hypothetical protein
LAGLLVGEPAAQQAPNRARFLAATLVELA